MRMSTSTAYVLGQSERAAHRLTIQDEQFATVSEQLLDSLSIQSDWRVVEFGCGRGGCSRRVARRLGRRGTLVGVDSSADLLNHAKRELDAMGGPRFEPICAN